MDWSQVNYLGVVVATVAAMALGFIWYAPAVFGKAWMGELGKTKETMNSPVIPMFVSLVSAFIMSLFLELLWIEMGVVSYTAAAVWALVIGVVFVGLNTLSDYLYSGQTIKLFVITGGYRVAMFLAAGLILVWL